jgi:YD repeat-containing protein
MLCSVCGFELAAPETACPRCGAFLGSAMGGSVAEPPRTFRYLLAGSLFILAALGGVAYHSASKPGFLDSLRDSFFNQAPREHAVVHGGVAKPDELQHHGQLYFVPMGRQAVPVESLAAYYRDKFKIEITVLAEVPIAPASYDSPRGQYIADDMIFDMKHAYPKIAAAADSVMIILTDEGIYPRSLGWKFTYSYRTGYKFAIVSSRRNDPAFWDQNKPHDPAAQLAGFKQMLTKYIALTYFHVPHSFDPTSVMYQPLTPDGGSDDLYESDLHSEESANGRRIADLPALLYAYSYKTGTLRLLAPSVEDSGHLETAVASDEELFETQLVRGEFFESTIDFQLASTPPIEFRRSYRSQDVSQMMALGRGTTHNYNNWLYSDDPAKLASIEVMYENGDHERLQRISQGIGMTPDVVFENRSGSEEWYRSRMAWDAGQLKLVRRDGEWFKFRACTNDLCFWLGYQDWQGHTLTFDRDDAGDLHRLTASDNQGIEFKNGPSHRMAEGKDSSGNLVSWAYDFPGRLVRVTHADGQVTLYSYDLEHRMTKLAVIRRPCDSPVTILSNEYDSAGRVARQTLADVGVYRMEYTMGSNNEATHVKLTEPSGRIVEITHPYRNAYVVRTTPVRFPAVQPPRKRGIP